MEFVTSGVELAIFFGSFVLLKRAESVKTFEKYVFVFLSGVAMILFEVLVWAFTSQPDSGNIFQLIVGIGGIYYIYKGVWGMLAAPKSPRS